MSISEFAWRLILIFTPGIVCLIIIRYLTIYREYSNFFFFVYSSILGLLSYSFLELIYWSYHLYCFSNWPHSGYEEPILLGNNLDIWKTIQNGDGGIPIDELLISLLFIAIPLALVFSKIIQEKVIIRAAQKLKITNKFGDDDLWSYFLNSKEIYWVWLRDLKRGVIYYGKIGSFSGPEREREILLLDVTVYSEGEGGVEELYISPAIYLTLNKFEFSIESVPLSAN